MADQTLTDAMRALALELGADLVGVASARKLGKDSLGLLPEAQSIVTIAVQAVHPCAIKRAEDVAFQVARFIEESGSETLVLSADKSLTKFNLPEADADFCTTCAVAAGLGSIDVSGCLVTPEFGLAQALCCIMTEANLEPSLPLDFEADEFKNIRIAQPPTALPDRMITEDLFRQAFDGEADIAAVILVSDFSKQDSGLHLDLPEAQSVFIFGLRLPTSCNDELTADTTADWAELNALDACRMLRRAGYEAVCLDNDATQQAVLSARLAKDKQGKLSTRDFGDRVCWGAVVTTANLQPQQRVHPIKPECPSDIEQARLDLMSLLMQEGADVVGVAQPRLVDELIESYRQQIDEAELKIDVYWEAQSEPEAKVREKARVWLTKDYLPGAKSVLVIGYRMPFASLERAGEPPANAIDAYCFATSHVNRWLQTMALKAARRLEEMGYRTTITTDLSETATQVAHPRGPQADALSNRFPAVAAGLTWLGLHGAPLHLEYGVTMRYIALVTDAPLPADTPLTDPCPCDDCDAPCIDACPAGALDDGEPVGVSCKDFEATLAGWERLRCEWAKRYALINAEGPRWDDDKTDIHPPDEIDGEVIVAALKQAGTPCQRQSRILECCLKACQMEGAWAPDEE